MSLEKLNENYNQIAATFSNSRKNLYWPELKVISKYINKVEKPKILDVGCGSGRFYKYLQEQSYQGEYLGIDQSSALIESAQGNFSQGQFKVLNLLDLSDLESKDYSTIVSLAMLHHLEPKHHLKAWQLLADKLESGGYLCLTVWNMWNRKRKKNWWNFVKDRLFLNSKKFYNKYKVKKSELGSWKNTIMVWRKNGQQSLYYYAFTKRELKKLCKEVGLEIEQLQYFNGNMFTAQNLLLIAKKK